MSCFLFRMASEFLPFHIIVLDISAFKHRLLINSVHKLFIRFDYLVKDSSMMECS